MSTEPTSIIADELELYEATQRDIFTILSKNVAKKLFWVAICFFASDMLALAIQNLVTAENIGIALVVPAVIAGMGFLARKEPLIAAVISGVITVAIWVLIIASLGAQGAISGWLVKAIVIYLLIAAIRDGAEANKIRRDLKQRGARL